MFKIVCTWDGDSGIKYGDLDEALLDAGLPAESFLNVVDLCPGQRMLVASNDWISTDEGVLAALMQVRSGGPWPEVIEAGQPIRVRHQGSDLWVEFIKLSAGYVLCRREKREVLYEHEHIHPSDLFAIYANGERPEVKDESEWLEPFF